MQVGLAPGCTATAYGYTQRLLCTGTWLHTGGILGACPFHAVIDDTGSFASRLIAHSSHRVSVDVHNNATCHGMCVLCMYIIGAPWITVWRMCCTKELPTAAPCTVWTMCCTKAPIATPQDVQMETLQGRAAVDEDIEECVHRRRASQPRAPCSTCDANAVCVYWQRYPYSQSHAL